jgi:hypothetical protein
LREYVSTFLLTDLCLPDVLFFFFSPLNSQKPNI